jgi:hypothetical protein
MMSIIATLLDVLLSLKTQIVLRQMLLRVDQTRISTLWQKYVYKQKFGKLYHSKSGYRAIALRHDSI